MIPFLPLALVLSLAGLPAGTVAGLSSAETPSAATSSVDTSSAGTSSVRPAPLVEYLWVTRSTLLDSTGVERLVSRARAAGVRGLLVQVVGRGDAFYRSDLLPRSEALDPSDFDPLAFVLERSHAA